MLGLRFCVGAFRSCGERGPPLTALRGPLTITASLVAEHRLQTRRLSNCGSRAQLLRGMWDPPSPGLKPVSPALAGRLSTTAPPGKPLPIFFIHHFFFFILFTMNLTGDCMGRLTLNKFYSMTAKFKNIVVIGTSLVIQWLRLRLPMQGVQVQSLVVA